MGTVVSVEGGVEEVVDNVKDVMVVEVHGDRSL